MTARSCRHDFAPEARDEAERLGGRARRACQIALHFGAAGAPHDVELLFGLDAFRGRLDAETRAKAGDRPNDDRAVTVAVDVLDEGAVDLDLVERERAQITQR